jgi:hypothetical protein
MIKKIIQLNRKAEDFFIFQLNRLEKNLRKISCRHEFILTYGHANALILYCDKCGRKIKTGSKTY